MTEEKKKKKGRPTKEERRDRKFRNALKGRARLAETSLSKLLWDFGSKKIVVSGNQRLDYQIIWALHCASDFIARDEWVDGVMTLPARKKSLYEEGGRYLVIIPYKQFKEFIGRDITIREAMDIFYRIPDITLTAISDDKKAVLPFGGRWGRIHFYKDNICGVAVAHEEERYKKHRSDGTIERGRTAGTEEPVFILLFSNDYGRAFVEGAMKRQGTRLQYVEMYQLDPRAQELYESMRWKTDIVIRNMEQISLVVGWKWPVKNLPRLSERKKDCQKLIDILYKEGFITRYRTRGQGEGFTWSFYVRKVRKEVLDREEGGSNNIFSP